MKLTKVILTLLLAVNIFSCDMSNSDKSLSQSNEAPISLSSKAAPAGFKVVGYVPDYKDINLSTIQFKKVTHINYSFLIPTNTGGMLPFERPNQLKALVAEAHKHNVKVQIAIGGWQYNGRELDPVFEQLAATDQGRANLVNTVMSVVNQYNLDGADMDWEHPDPVAGATGSAYNYLDLMRKLHAQLNPQGKILTCAILPGVTADGMDQYWAKGILDELFTFVDFFNIMVYDGGDGDRHSPYSMAVNSINYWITKRQMPRSKYVLGVPFYGRPGWKAYWEIVALDPTAPNKDIVNGMYYNGIDTIKRKAQLAIDNANGIMIWELTHDTTDNTSLLSAIHEVVGPPLPPDPHAPTPPMNLTGMVQGPGKITLNWTASTDNIGVAGYKIYLDNTLLKNQFGGATTATISNTPGGLHVLTVTAYDAVGNESPHSNSVSIDVPNPTLPEWDSTKVYIGGMRVTWAGQNWKAKWWNQNQEPGKAGVWALLSGTDTEPPTTPTNLLSQNLLSRSVDLIWNPSNDNLGVVGYKVSYGSIIIDVTTNKVTVTGLIPETTYTFLITAYDAAGNTSLAATITVITPQDIPDHTPPTVPTGLTTETITSNSISLYWKPSVDNIQVIGYNVYVNGVLTATVTSPNATINNLTPDTTYLINVSAFDATPNTSAQSTGLSVKTLPINPNPEWAPYTSYEIGNIVIYKGIRYRCQFKHTSLPNWTPDAVPALWVREG
jgi:GH18 family chitinase/chitodextrinase